MPLISPLRLSQPEYYLHTLSFLFLVRILKKFPVLHYAFHHLLISKNTSLFRTITSSHTTSTPTIVHNLDREDTIFLPTHVVQTVSALQHHLDYYYFTFLPHIFPFFIPRYSSPLTPSEIPIYATSVPPSYSPTIFLSPNTFFIQVCFRERI